MKRMVLMIATVALMATTGCYCGAPFSGGYNQGFGGGCRSGNCGMNAPMGAPANIPQGSYYQSYNSIQSAAVPVSPYSGHPVTASAPLESLPTY
jgi:hypothetical protein